MLGEACSLDPVERQLSQRLHEALLLICCRHTLTRLSMNSSHPQGTATHHNALNDPRSRKIPHTHQPSDLRPSTRRLHLWRRSACSATTMGGSCSPSPCTHGLRRRTRGTAVASHALIGSAGETYSANSSSPRRLPCRATAWLQSTALSPSGCCAAQLLGSHEGR